MPDYRRWYVPGGMYFFTVVTYKRSPIFRDPIAIQTLGEAMRHVRAKAPFKTVAIALLWDHLHCVWSLPRGDGSYSARWQGVKKEFTEHWLARQVRNGSRSELQQRRGEQSVWQRRFWEHVIRDETDLERHVDYIHYNPVKHGYVTSPGDWPWSSFGKYVRGGHYPEGWGSTEPAEPFPQPRE